ncbi:MAG: hypothetical protein ABIL70_06220, partial [candidate division WOR-3 bacterium]
MKIRIFAIFCTCIINLYAKLMSVPFITEPDSIQRLGWECCTEHMHCHIFSSIYGISLANLRTDRKKWLSIMTDPSLSRIIYGLGKDEDGVREGLFLKPYPSAPMGYTHFNSPYGICIDTALYLGNQNWTFIYVVDGGNNRIVRLKYDAAAESLVHHDYISEGFFNKPRGISCVADPIGGSYIVVADAGNNRIVIYKMNPDGSYVLKMNYGTEGNGVGQFKFPQGVSISQEPGQQGNYYIYVADKKNHRLVCLKYFATDNTIEWRNVYNDPGDSAWFCGIVSNPFYCVYTTDCRNHKIWVFTPELTELLYTYGEEGYGTGQFESPTDICIIGDEIAITEDWTATTGIQYFKIIPEIREFYPEPQNFDATEDSVKINFRVDETAHYLTMEVAGRKIFENQYFVPGHYSVYWDGRGADGKVVLPGNYTIRIRCQQEVIATAGVTVKG